MDTERRLASLRAKMDEEDLEALWVTGPANRRYLTGFTGTSGYVLVTLHKAVFFTDFRYMEQAAGQVKNCEIRQHGPNVLPDLKAALEEERIVRLGFEQEHVSYGTYLELARDLPGVELVPAKGLVEQLRMVKDAGEVEILRQAARIADEAFEHILSFVRPGVTEKEVAWELETFMRSKGADSASFDTIVASGARSALPHGVASDKPIAEGELVTFDFGAYYRGYCSDLTRTVMVGKETGKHREIYDIVLEAQMHALENLRPGMTGKEADALTRNIIQRYGYSDYFGHGTGHGIGLEIHEAPWLSVTGETVLQPGMTVTVEPGIYLPGFGGVRIEDDVVITDTGAERLTASPKHWTRIG
jgi:Xaa-Pro aminopeptidase